MINFLRKLRREKVNGSYFKYAFGEIALVVIGILIALAINNWNENRKEDTQLKGYLTSIQKNLKADTVAINIVNRNYKKASAAAQLFMRELLVDTYSGEVLINAAVEVLGEEYVTIDQSGYEALKNSGFISKLQGTPIVDALFKYYGQYQIVLKAEESYNNFIEQMEASLYGMNNQDILDATKILNQLNQDKYSNISPTSQPIDKVAQRLSQNAYIIGMMSRAAEEDTDQYDRLLEYAKDLLKEINVIIDPKF